MHTFAPLRIQTFIKFGRKATKFSRTSENLQRYERFAKNQLANVCGSSQNFENSTRWLHRSREMLQNENLLVNFGANTAENRPIFANFFEKLATCARVAKLLAKFCLIPVDVQHLQQVFHHKGLVNSATSRAKLCQKEFLRN